MDASDIAPDDVADSEFTPDSEIIPDPLTEEDLDALYGDWCNEGRGFGDAS